MQEGPSGPASHIVKVGGGFAARISYQGSLDVCVRWCVGVVLGWYLGMAAMLGCWDVSMSSGGLLTLSGTGFCLPLRHLVSASGGGKGGPAGLEYFTNWTKNPQIRIKCGTMPLSFSMVCTRRRPPPPPSAAALRRRPPPPPSTPHQHATRPLAALTTDHYPRPAGIRRTANCNLQVRATGLRHHTDGPPPSSASAPSKPAAGTAAPTVSTADAQAAHVAAHEAGMAAQQALGDAHGDDAHRRLR